MRADLDLPWFFGSSPQNVAGDSGLRCSLGNAGGGGSFDVSALEDAMIRRVGTGSRWAEIRDRLATLEPGQCRVLQLHYAERSIVFSVSACAVLCPMAVELCAPGPVTREAIGEALRTRGRSGSTSAWVALEGEAQELLGPARLAYERADVEGRKRAPLRGCPECRDGYCRRCAREAG